MYTRIALITVSNVETIGCIEEFRMSIVYVCMQCCFEKTKTISV